MTTPPPAPRARHPREVLFEAGDEAVSLPVCDHYAGVEVRMRKSLALQAELGPVFDVTLDGEDGAPAGAEVEHAHLMAEVACSAENRFDRVGARIVPFSHPAFEAMLEVLLTRAGARLAYLMLPKLQDAAEAVAAIAHIDARAAALGCGPAPPLHGLIETHGALHHVHAIAALPRIESLSFGLMDFVSAHRGAIPSSGMGVEGQFSHPLVVRAKLEIAAACHGHGKTPSHCVVTEFKDMAALAAAATRASRQLGYTRMWSIHPGQVRTIVEAFAPTAAEVDQAIEIIHAAQAARWAPIRHRDTLHDRASFRYYWQVIERARRTGQPLPAEVRLAWFGAGNL